MKNSLLRTISVAVLTCCVLYLSTTAFAAETRLVKALPEGGEAELVFASSPLFSMTETPFTVKLTGGAGTVAGVLPTTTGRRAFIFITHAVGVMGEFVHDYFVVTRGGHRADSSAHVDVLTADAVSTGGRTAAPPGVYDPKVSRVARSAVICDVDDSELMSAVGRVKKNC